MKKVFTKSVYVAEPSSQRHEWDNHWNYEWSGRNSLGDVVIKAKYRKENENTFLVRDNNGIVWEMDAVEFNKYKKEHKLAC